jgi:hypothetical protein
LGSGVRVPFPALEATEEGAAAAAPSLVFA